MLSVPAWAQYPPNQNGEQNPPNQNAPAAQIGAINYVEGSASINGQELGTNSVGSAVLVQGQELTTQTGRVEILLTPGVFLRVDHNSAVKMVSPDLADTKVAVLKGRAMVEVTDVGRTTTFE